MENVILDGRYEIIEQIGVGGMAKVYKAKDKLLGRFVAIKVLKDEYAEDEEFLKKFNNEAQSAARLSHINIVNVYDIGKDMLNGKLIQYIVMEYVEGETLKDYINREKVLSNHDIIDYSTQIAQALKSAHDSGIVHRDIKPQNILIDKFGLCKVTDFGIARVSSNATITYTSSILGTVHYISPEQAKGKIVDHKSDLYSLGALMYEMATGKVPFDADNSVGIAVMHIQEDPVPPREINPDLSKHLNYIIMKLLKKDPTERFQNAGELIEALDNPSMPVEEDTSGDTAKIPIVIPKKKRKVFDHEDDIDDKEAVYKSSSEKKIKKEKAKNPIKIWPLALLALVLVALVYFINNRMSSDELEVPTVVNLSQEQAVEQLEKRGFKANISRTAESDEYEKGKVMSQDPEASTKAKKGSIVNLIISSGREVEVPELKNMNLSQAEETLKDLGLKLGKTSTDYSNTVEKDLVIRQEPSSGQFIQTGSEVDVVISVGKENTTEIVKVPLLLGMSEADAIAAAKKASLKVRSVDYQYSNNTQKGLVMSQSISAETEVAEDSAIDLIISLGQEEKQEEKADRQVEMRLNVASDKENFNVKVYKVDQSGQRSEVLYDRNHTSSDLDESGILILRFMSMSNTSVEVFVDDESYGVYTVS